MKKVFFTFVLTLMVFLIFPSCNRDSVPARVIGKSIKNYDEAQFNYLYVEAVKQKLLGNAGEALKYFEQAVRINPASDGCYYQIAQILVANGDNVNGKKYLQKALSIDEDNVWYLLMISGIYYEDQKLDSAITYYERIVKTDPERMNSLLTLGNLYSENERWDEAIKVYDSFESKYGVNENSTVSAIKNLVMAGRFAEAETKAKDLLAIEPDNILYNGMLAEIYRADKNNQKAFAVYRDLIERNPDNAQIQLSLCDFLLSEKSYGELFELLTTVIINENVSKEEKVSLLARMIEDKEISGNYEQKLVLALMVLEANYKDDDIVVLLRPELYSNLDKGREAALRLEEIVKADINNYFAWEKLLLVYLQLEDYALLMTRGEVCATQFNRSFLAKILYANGAIEMGKFDIALTELKKADILAGNDKDMKMQVLTMRADIHYRQKDYESAFREFDAALQLNNDDLTVLNNYAYYLAEQDLRLKEAENMILRVISVEKENTTFLDTYAWVLYKRGKLKEADKVMNKVINSGQKPDPEWYEHYGYILMKRKKCDLAVLNWNIAMKLDPDKTHLVKAIEACTK